ncbi:hypothetical protein Tco_0844012 [Tanacetum coccineum]
MSANGKLSRAGKSVTYQKCNRQGHNIRSFKGIVGGSQASSVEGSHASSVRGSKASSIGVSKRARGSQTGTSSATKRFKA